MTGDSDVIDNKDRMPSVREVRKRIMKVGKEKYRRCLQFIYLVDGRVSEAVGRASRSDTTTAWGPTGDDVSFQVYDEANKVEAALFNVRTAKNRGKPRICAIPLDPECEPWARQVALYFSKFGSRERVFPFTRQAVYNKAKKVFKGLRYPIDQYKNTVEVFTGDGVKKKPVIVPTHWKPFRIHALRHLRATDLLSYYGFSTSELSKFGGWRLANSALDSYIYYDWRSYFPKLLKKRFS